MKLQDEAAETTKERTDYVPLLYLFQAPRAGACGYVLKSGADRDLVEACRSAMRGRLAAARSECRLIAATHNLLKLHRTA